MAARESMEKLGTLWAYRKRTRSGAVAPSGVHPLEPGAHRDPRLAPRSVCGVHGWLGRRCDRRRRHCGIRARQGAPRQETWREQPASTGFAWTDPEKTA